MTDRSKAYGDSHITIPPEALEAAVKAYFATPADTYTGWIEDACLAMLKAWPGSYSLTKNDSADIRDVAAIILPLPQEASDD